MHAESLRLMKQLRRHVRPASRVLDAGGVDLNGSYRSLFADCRYTTLDYDPRADIVVTGYSWPLDDESFDVVVCGQMLEHDRFFWLTLSNIARVLRPGGWLLLIVPSAGHEHRFPVDCWRFLPDSVAAMADWAKLEKVEVLRGKGEWADVAVAMRKPAR
jgi:SAM-dependent methyltransferase